MIIKCPECGRQVSDRAPICPSCGVKIAGDIIVCPNCGEAYFRDRQCCPSCNMRSDATASQPHGGYEPPRQAEPRIQPQRVEPQRVEPQPAPAVAQRDDVVDIPSENDAVQPEEQKNGGKGTIVAAVIFALIICGGLFYFYFNAQQSKEQEDYEYAMQSTDPVILQSYLDRFPDAPSAHRDSIQAHLVLLQKGDEEWQNAVLSNSRAALVAYIEHNPESIHCQEARNKIDSLDWIAVQNSEDVTRIKDYVTQHPDGRYIDEANLLLDRAKSVTVLPEEKSMVQGIFRQFFQSINGRDESRLVSSVAMVVNSFLGKQNATSSDVVSFMNKIYKEDITSMTWRIDGASYAIKKRAVGDNESEFDVTFNCQQEINRTDASKEKLATFRVQGVVNSEGKISSFNLTKIVNQ